MVILPIEKDLNVRTYLYHALPNSIIMSDKNYETYFYNQFIQLVYFKNNNVPKITLDFFHTKFIDLDIFQKEIISKQTLNNNNVNIDNYIINAINSGYYIIVYLNEYHIPTRNVYMHDESEDTRYYMHENLIYGYDENAKIFYSLAYDYRYIFCTTEIPFENLIQGFNDTKENNKVISLKLNKSYPSSLNLNLIHKSLIDYYNSTNSYKANKLIDYYGELDYLTPNEFDNAAYGLNAMKNLQICLNKTIATNASIDMRAFFLLKEHKKLMFKRLDYLNKNKILDINNILIQYGEVENISNILFNYWFKFFRRKNLDYINSMIDYIDLIYQKEKYIIELLLNDFIKKS